MDLFHDRRRAIHFRPIGHVFGDKRFGSHGFNVLGTVRLVDGDTVQ